MGVVGAIGRGRNRGGVCSPRTGLTAHRSHVQYNPSAHLMTRMPCKRLAQGVDPVLGSAGSCRRCRARSARECPGNGCGDALGVRPRATSYPPPHDLVPTVHALCPPSAAAVSWTRDISCPAASRQQTERSMGTKDTPPTTTNGRRAAPAASREATSCPEKRQVGVSSSVGSSACLSRDSADHQQAPTCIDGPIQAPQGTRLWWRRHPARQTAGCRPPG